MPLHMAAAGDWHQVKEELTLESETTSCIYLSVYVQLDAKVGAPLITIIISDHNLIIIFQSSYFLWTSFTPHGKSNISDL